jgi:DDE superfamily endonuclease
MEDVLDLYEQPYDPKRPMVCFDERPCQLIEDILAPIAMKPGKPKIEDYEYSRNGICFIFIAFQPHTGKRFIQVRGRRTKVDYAQFMKELVEKHYPDVECIRLVQDNLNTHCGGSFYEAFSAREAFVLAKKFEYHYTPKKGSWLNMAEIELSALAKQCLGRRIGDMETLAKEAYAWERRRNQIRATVNWRFTKDDARDKFRRHYHIIHN